MKIELELDDYTVSRMGIQPEHGVWIPGEEDPPRPTPERVARYVHWLVMRYANAPEIATDQHRNALTVIRGQAVEQAVRIAKGGTDFDRLVDRIIEATVGRA